MRNRLDSRLDDWPPTRFSVAPLPQKQLIVITADALFLPNLSLIDSFYP